MNIEMWGWPQWVILGWFALETVYTGFKHREPRPGNYNVGASLLVWIIVVLILGAGGFWS